MPSLNLRPVAGRLSRATASSASTEAGGTTRPSCKEDHSRLPMGRLCPGFSTRRAIGPYEPNRCSTSDTCPTSLSPADRSTGRSCTCSRALLTGTGGLRSGSGRGSLWVCSVLSKVDRVRNQPGADGPTCISTRAPSDPGGLRWSILYANSGADDRRVWWLTAEWLGGVARRSGETEWRGLSRRRATPHLYSLQRHWALGGGELPNE